MRFADIVFYVIYIAGIIPAGLFVNWLFILAGADPSFGRTMVVTVSACALSAVPALLWYTWYTRKS